MISLSPPRTLPCTLAKRPACVTACSRRTATRAVHLSQVTATVAEVAESSADGLAGLSPNEYVYVGLGLTALSFVLTFAVAPRFKTSFKEKESWIEIYDRLMEAGGVPSISPKEAAERAKRGKSVMMDIRMARKYAGAAARYSRNYPIYQPISGSSLPANIRRAGFAFFGIYGSERNPDFIAECEKDIKKGKEIIVVCDFGGSLRVSPGQKSGFQSQSLKAAYYLKQAGYTNVLFMKGGLDAYNREVEALLDEEEQAAAATAPAKGVFSVFGSR